MRKVAVIFGGKSKDVVDALKVEIDDIELKPYESVEVFKHYIEQNNYPFDRVLINTNVVEGKIQNNLTELYKFMRTNLPETSLLLFVSAQDTSNIQDTFLRIFKLSIYTDILVQQSTISLIESSLIDSVTNLRKHYSSVKVEEDPISQEQSESYEEISQPSTGGIAVCEYPDGVVNKQAVQPIKQSKEFLIKARKIKDINSHISQRFDLIGQDKITKGYWNGKHYDLDISDMDPTILIAKQRVSNNELKALKIKEKPVGINKELTPKDMLVQEYRERNAISLQSLITNKYELQAVVKLNKANSVQNNVHNNVQQSTEKVGIFKRILGLFKRSKG